MQYRNITISGEVCSGKSSISDALAKRLGWKTLSIGLKFREYCNERNYTVTDISDLPDEIHQNYDDHFRKILASSKHLIIEGRLAGWLAQGFEDIFKVFLTAPLDVRIRRYMNRQGQYSEKIGEELLARDRGDLFKYRNLYGIPDYRDEGFYDFVIDTSQLSIERTTEMILESIHPES